MTFIVVAHATCFAFLHPSKSHQIHLICSLSYNSKHMSFNGFLYYFFSFIDKINNLILYVHNVNFICKRHCTLINCYLHGRMRVSRLVKSSCIYFLIKKLLNWLTHFSNHADNAKLCFSHINFLSKMVPKSWEVYINAYIVLIFFNQ